MSKNNKYELSDIDLDTAIDALSYCRPSDREEWVQIGMSIKSEFGEDAWPAWDFWTKQEMESQAKTAFTVWKSFKRKGITIGTMIDLALQGGFEFKNKKLSKIERKRLESERKTRLAKRKIEEELAEQKIMAWREKLSDFLFSTMQYFNNEGSSDYLKNKRVAEFGLLFAQEPMILVVDQEKNLTELYFGHDRISEFFDLPKEEKPKFTWFKKGIFAIPLVDINGRLWNLQIIYASGIKRYLPGRKQGCFHLIGSVPSVGRFNLGMAEGYANGAPIHMALKCPVVVAFDSGNLKPVAEHFLKKYGDRVSRFVVFADDDQHLVKKGKKNVGLEKAKAAAKVFNGIVIPPVIDKPSTEAKLDDRDILYDEAAAFVIDKQRASISGLQRGIKIGYNRAARIIEQLEKADIVSEISTNGKRKVLKTKVVEGSIDGE